MLEFEYKLELALEVILGILVLEVVFLLEVTFWLVAELRLDDVVAFVVEVSLLELPFAFVLVDKEGRFAAEAN